MTSRRASRSTSTASAGPPAWAARAVAVTFVSEWDLEFFDAIKAHVGEDLTPMEVSLYQSAAGV